ncbi:MAG: protein kinase [Planctomycetes bacterium]|nr:protein kinase [Planctomycetota bacterium]
MTSDPVDALKRFLAESQTEGAPEDDESAAFGWLAVQMGHESAREIAEANADRGERARRGERWSLREVLEKRGALLAEDSLAIQRALERIRHACERCGHMSYPLHTAGEESLRCCRCGSELPTVCVTPPAPGRFRGSLSPPVQRILGKYRLVRELGRGGMGVVYEAEDPTLRRQVALKVLLDADAPPSHVRRLEREAEASAQLSHPNVVRVHEVGAAIDPASGGPVHFIAMELVAGETLRQAGERLSFAEKVRILAEVGDGVGHAHSRGVVHRDLKPENVLLAAGGRPVVSDFGLASWREARTRLTRPGAIMGSPCYMAPEQVRGETAAIGPPADVWALGVMLYEVLTGKLPFQEAPGLALFRAILLSDPVRPAALSSGVPRDLEAVCLKCLEKSPRARYSDGAEFAAEIGRWRRGEGVRARRVGVLGRVSRRLRRNPWISAAWGALGLVVLSAVLVTAALGIRSSARARADRYASEAALAYATGDLARTEDLARGALAEVPDHPEARYWLGRLRLREYEGARGFPEVRLAAGIVELLPARPETTAQKRLREEATRMLDGTHGEPLAAAVRALCEDRPEEALAVLDEFLRSERSSPTHWEFDVLACRCLYRLGRFEEARARLEPFLVLDPARTAPLWGRLMLALGLEAERHGSDPDPWFERASDAGRRLEAESSPDEGRLLRVMAQTLLAGTRWRRGVDPEPKVDEALGLIERTGTPDAWVARGDALFLRAEHRKARGRISLADPCEYQEAIDAYSRALDIDPTHGPAYLKRAEVHRTRWGIESLPENTRQADRDAALADYERALGASGRSVAAKVGMAWALGVGARGDEVDLDRTLAGFDEEIARVSEVLEEEPRSIQAVLRRGSLFQELALYRKLRGVERMEEYVSAAADFDRALVLDPDSVEALRGRAAVHGEISRYFLGRSEDPFPEAEKCLSDLARALEIHPGDADTLIVRSKYYRGLGFAKRLHGRAPMEDLLAAIDDASGAIEIRKVWAGDFLARAWAYRELGDHLADQGQDAAGAFEKGIADLFEALRFNSQLVECYRIRAMLHQRIGRHDLAVEDCEIALRTDPTYGQRSSAIHLVHAIALRLVGEARAAGGESPIASYRAAIQSAGTGTEVNPNDPDLWRQRGFARFRLAVWMEGEGDGAASEYRGAIADFDEILQRFPSDPAVGRWREERAMVEARLLSLRGR